MHENSNHDNQGRIKLKIKRVDTELTNFRTVLIDNTFDSRNNIIISVTAAYKNDK